MNLSNNNSNKNLGLKNEKDALTAWTSSLTSKRHL